MAVAEAVFWVCGALLLYVFVGYPLLMRALGRAFPRRIRRAPIEPSVSVLVVARDEQARVVARLSNLIRLDYPSDRVEILLGSDGSIDATVRATRPFEYRVHVFDFPSRRGKAAVLNDLVSRASGEILVFADARQHFSPTALRALVAPFADPAVGGVGGELVLADREDASEVGRGMGAYWRYEKAIRAAESAFGSTVGATGAVYAIRRSLYEPIPPDTILDDVLIPMRIVRRGFRVVFEPRAQAIDRPPEDARHELRRKIRTIAGNFQLFARERWLLDPRRNPVWLQTVSHKGLRLLGPALLAGTLGASLLLSGRPMFGAALAAHLFVATAAALDAVTRESGRRIPGFSAAFFFVLLQVATVAAFVRFARGRLDGIWEPSCHSSAASSNSTRSSERSIR
jgi:cellulose synthase/poly-beta-1,6-N-acetylglucosamine synthase-like glycosyltransferase